MKKNIVMLLCLFLSLSALSQTPAQQLANHIAQKMKDTLGLSTQQRNDIYNINMSLHQQKQEARQLHSGPDLRNFLQAIEHTRDSLYHNVLPNEKYLLYIEKKSNLVSAN